MDPFKVLGIAARKMSQPSDLDPVRHKAKQLFKRYMGEKKKFDAKKVLEAFDQIKQRLKGRLGEGPNKILGRSRKERELDKHFNHQTKEIKKNKGLRRELKRARKGEKRLHLPGDKERIPRPRRKRRRHTKVTRVDALEGLQRLAAFLAHKQKFAKALKLLHRWLKEYMNPDIREYAFIVLQGVVDSEFFLDDPDARQDVVMIFEYVLAFYSQWFESEEQHKMLGQNWLVATVLACRCFTDDAFILSATIAKLNDALAIIEKHQDELREADSRPAAPAATPPYMKSSSSLSLATSPTLLASPGSSTRGEGDEFEEAKEEDEDLLDTDEEEEEEVKEEVKGEVKEEVKGEVKEEAKEELIDLDSDAESVKSEISSGSSSGSEGGVEEVEEDIFPCPSAIDSLLQARKHLIGRCLSTLFQHRGPLWAKPKIDVLFQDVFYRRGVFAPEQQTQVEAWQARIKTLQRLGEREVGEANNPLEAHRPVVDSRETRVNLDSAAHAWACKQTFDSRDRDGGSKVIR